MTDKPDFLETVQLRERPPIRPNVWVDGDLVTLNDEMLLFAYFSQTEWVVSREIV
jgi:hypothetical protein